MAFTSGRTQVTCKECKKVGKFFKMFQSWRDEDTWTDEEGRKMATLICPDCELKKRVKEWANWNDDEKELAGEDYATMAKVLKEQKVGPGILGQRELMQLSKPRLGLRP